MVVNVKLKFYAVFRDLTGKKEEEISLEKGAKVRDLITTLKKMYGEKMGKILMGAEGNLNPSITILLNGKNVNTLKGLETEIDDKSVIAIFPPFSGGILFSPS